MHLPEATKTAAASVMIGAAVAAAPMTGCRGVGSSRFVVLPGAEPETQADALRIDAAGLRVEYSPELDRILAIAPEDGPNLLHTANLEQQPDDDAGYTFFGGAYFWVSPQHGPNGWADESGETRAWPPDPAMDRGPARVVSRTDTSFTAVNPIDRAGLVQEKEVQITGPGQLEVRYRLTNRSEETKSRGVWINTATPGDAVVAVRLPGYEFGAESVLGEVDAAMAEMESVAVGAAEMVEGDGDDADRAETTPAEVEGALEQADAGTPAALDEAARDEPSPEAEAREDDIRRRAKLWAWNEQSAGPLRDVMRGPDANGWYLIDLTEADWAGGTKFYFDAPAELAVWVPEGKKRKSGFWLHRRQLAAVNAERLIENGEAPVALYIDPAAELIEAELYGPLVDLEPGETHEAIELWTVYPATAPNTAYMNTANVLSPAR